MDNNIKCEHKILRARPSKKSNREEKKGRPDRAARTKGVEGLEHNEKRQKHTSHNEEREREGEGGGERCRMEAETKGSSNIISSVEKIFEMLRKLTFCFSPNFPLLPMPINGSEKWSH